VSVSVTASRGQRAEVVLAEGNDKVSALGASWVVYVSLPRL